MAYAVIEDVDRIASIILITKLRILLSVEGLVTPPPDSLDVSPTPAPISETWADDYTGEHFLTIAIQFDLWPEDTGWILERAMDSNGENAGNNVVDSQILSIR
eukprot:5491296-Ditylum_brightwellii.AAC.1